jgi:hypothetical protein
MVTASVSKTNLDANALFCRIEHGYPTPSLGRDAVLEKALPWLQQYGIWSRGRFGSYKVQRGRWDMTQQFKSGGHSLLTATA